MDAVRAGDPIHSLPMLRIPANATAVNRKSSSSTYCKYTTVLSTIETWASWKEESMDERLCCGY